MDRRFDLVEQTLIAAAYETMDKQKVSLTKENYSYFINNALVSIIFDDFYLCFTSRNHARENVMSLFNRENAWYDFIQFLYYKVGDSVESKTVLPSAEEVMNLIKSYAYQILPNQISHQYFQPSNSFDEEAYHEKLKEKIDSIQNYAPSDACRDAIMSGRQFMMNHSSHYVAGMQAVSDVGKVRKNQE